MNQHPDNDPANDDPRVDDSVGMTVGNSVIDHREGMMVERLADGLLHAGCDLEGTLKEPRPASGNAVLDDQGIVATSMGQRFVQAGKALAGDDADHHQHQDAISARRASSSNAGNDEADMMESIVSAGHLSGLTSVGIETPRGNSLARDWSPESVDGPHLSAPFLRSLTSRKR